MSAMAGEIDIKALAELARLEVGDEELATLEREIPDILNFVRVIEKAAASSEEESPSLRNVVRADENPHESGVYTEKLLKAAPAREGNRIAVKQVLKKNKE